MQAAVTLLWGSKTCKDQWLKHSNHGVYLKKCITSYFSIDYSTIGLTLGFGLALGLVCVRDNDI